MPPEVVYASSPVDAAWIAFGLTVAAQLVGVGTVYGIITTKLNGVRKELAEHKSYPPSRGHEKED